jgi:hypothetical protein
MNHALAVAAYEETQVSIWIQKYSAQIVIVIIHSLLITVKNGYTLDSKVNFVFVVSIPLCYIKFRSHILSNTTR